MFLSETPLYECSQSPAIYSQNLVYCLYTKNCFRFPLVNIFCTLEYDVHHFGMMSHENVRHDRSTHLCYYAVMLGGIELRVCEFSHYSTPQKAAVVCITFWLLHVDDKVYGLLLHDSTENSSIFPPS